MSGMRCALSAAVLVLASCDSKLKPDECSDHRLLTFSERNIFGWNDFHTSRVCVVAEKKLNGENP